MSNWGKHMTENSYPNANTEKVVLSKILCKRITFRFTVFRGGGSERPSLCKLVVSYSQLTLSIYRWSVSMPNLRVVARKMTEL